VKEAFAFGKDFCDAVTLSNPPPVQLKLEKVYMGTLLQTVCSMSDMIRSLHVLSFRADKHYFNNIRKRSIAA